MIETETKYSKIFVAIDGSKESMNAARHAIGLAKKDGTHSGNRHQSIASFPTRKWV